MNNTLSVKTQIKRKKKSNSIQNKQLFTTIITELEKSIERENVLLIKFGMDYHHYDESFYTIIDKLIQLKFGQGISELIFFYIYDRVNIDGTINVLKNEKDEEIKLDTPEDLWNLILTINPDLDKENK